MRLFGKNRFFSWEEKLVAPLIATPNVDKAIIEDKKGGQKSRLQATCATQLQKGKQFFFATIWLKSEDFVTRTNAQSTPRPSLPARTLSRTMDFVPSLSTALDSKKLPVSLSIFSIGFWLSYILFSEVASSYCPSSEDFFSYK